MKTLRLCIAALILTALVGAGEVQAQTVIGAKAGVNIAKQSLSADGASVTFDSRTAFVGGAFANFGFGSPWYVQPEVLYSSKGFAVDGESLSLDYLEVPLLVGAAFPLDNSTLRPNVFAGPVVGFKLSCDAEGEDCSEGYKSVDFGVVFGAGLIYGTGNLELFLDGRYQLGLTDVGDISEVLEEGVSVKNRVWQIMAGVGFPVGN